MNLKLHKTTESKGKKIGFVFIYCDIMRQFFHLILQFHRKIRGLMITTQTNTKLGRLIADLLATIFPLALV